MDRMGVFSKPQIKMHDMKRDLVTVKCVCNQTSRMSGVQQQLDTGPHFPIILYLGLKGQSPPTCPDSPSSVRMKRSVHWSHLHKPSFKTSPESFSHQHLLGLQSHHRPPVQCGETAQAPQACPAPTRRWHRHCQVQGPHPEPKGVPDCALWGLLALPPLRSGPLLQASTLIPRGSWSPDSCLHAPTRLLATASQPI